MSLLFKRRQTRVASRTTSESPNALMEVKTNEETFQERTKELQEFLIGSARDRGLEAIAMMNAKAKL